MGHFERRSVLLTPTFRVAFPQVVEPNEQDVMNALGCRSRLCRRSWPGDKAGLPKSFAGDPVILEAYRGLLDAYVQRSLTTFTVTVTVERGSP